MTGAWEYARLTYTYRRKKISFEDPEASKLPAATLDEWRDNDWAFYWWYDEVFVITRPTLPVETFVNLTTLGESDHDLMSLLNQLGAEGWEAFTIQSPYTALMPLMGFDQASASIQSVILLKRAVGGPG